MVDLCFATHHLQFDKKGILWFSSGGGAGGVIGWLDVNKCDQTKDERPRKAGRRSFSTPTATASAMPAGSNPMRRVDPAKDKRIVTGLYGVSPVRPTAACGARCSASRAASFAIDPKTQLSEVYEVPWKNAKVACRAGQGFGPRGNDITTNGVVWTVLASGHFASFDRRLCNATKIKGRPSPIRRTPVRKAGSSIRCLGRSSKVKKVSPARARKRRITIGSISTTRSVLARTFRSRPATDGDSLRSRERTRWVVLRVAYPIGYFAKGLDGRIDDPATGWKGKGLWSTYSTRAVHHIEGGKGNTSKVVHFQLTARSAGEVSQPGLTRNVRGGFHDREIRLFFEFLLPEGLGALVECRPVLG